MFIEEYYDEQEIDTPWFTMILRKK